MKELAGGCLALVGIIVVIFGFSWIATGNDFFLYRYFAPKQEAVRREVFEQSKAYNQGVVQELEAMRFDYVKTNDPQAKAALASVILHRSADYDENKLPADLRGFIQSLKSY